MSNTQTQIPLPTKYGHLKKILLGIIGTALITGIAVAAVQPSTKDYLEKSYQQNLETYKTAQELTIKAQQNERESKEAMCESRKALAAYKLTLKETRDHEHLNKILSDCTYDF